MPKGYFFVEVEIADPAAYEAYRTTVPDIIAAQGGRILVRGGDPQPFDGVMPQRRRVIVEFDSPEAVKTFYYSDAYQAVLPIRLNASNGFVCLQRNGIGPPLSRQPLEMASYPTLRTPLFTRCQIRILNPT
jgi:uncharacterized protein (DUF1330 family)